MIAREHAYAAGICAAGLILGCTMFAGLSTAPTPSDVAAPTVDGRQHDHLAAAHRVRHPRDPLIGPHPRPPRQHRRDAATRTRRLRPASAAHPLTAIRPHPRGRLPVAVPGRTVEPRVRLVTDITHRLPLRHPPAEAHDHAGSAPPGRSRPGLHPPPLRHPLSRARPPRPKELVLMARSYTKGAADRILALLDGDA